MTEPNMGRMDRAEVQELWNRRDHLSALEVRCLNELGWMHVALAEAQGELDQAKRSLSDSPKWISVDDRVPIEGQQVLVWVPGYGVALDEFNTWSEAPAGAAIGGHVVCGPWFLGADDPTHWMPLPEAPK